MNSTRQIRKRVERVQERMCPKRDGRWSGTLEEFCRMLWDQERKLYLKLVAEGDPTLRCFRGQFEREDDERRLRAARIPTGAQ